jgi:hypothetical protein
VGQLPPDIKAQLVDGICRPVGSATFDYYSRSAFKKKSNCGVLEQIISKGHIFRIERTENNQICFIHSSPGTGTRLAEIGLDSLPDFEHAFLAFTWSPKEVTFYMQPRIDNSNMLMAKGIPCDYELRVGKNGDVYKVGSKGIDVMGLRITKGGKEVLSPTAIESWNNMLAGIDILLTGKSDQGFIYEVVVTCLIISILVTGMEAYMKKRFIEIESEGISPNEKKLLNSFSSRKERCFGLFREIRKESFDKNISLIEVFVLKRRINFQNYQNIKKAFKSTYGISFGKIFPNSYILEDIQQFIKCRHKIIHTSPIQHGILYFDKKQNNLPVFANKETRKKALQCFKVFIEVIHNATLCLQRID